MSYLLAGKKLVLFETTLWKMIHLFRPLSLIIILSFFIIVTGCGGSDDEDPYAEILNRSPFSAVTDSIKKNPGMDELYFRRAVLLNKNNFPEPALADFRKAWSLKKDERYAFGVSKLLLDRKPDSAIIFLTSAMKELPASVLLPINLAHAFALQNKIDEALKTCNMVLMMDSTQVNIYLLKSELLEKKGDTGQSIATLEKAQQLNPRDPELSHNLAFKYAQTKSAKTIPFCDSLIARDAEGSHAEPYYFKAVYYSNTGEKATALSFFNQAIQHDYNFLDAHMEKGGLLFDQKKYKDALKTFTLVNTISPTYADGYFWAGKCQAMLGQKDEARLNYLRAYGLDKTMTEAKEAADSIGN
jgi:tetratricopeptide (TPR) repeat protein